MIKPSLSRSAWTLAGQTKQLERSGPADEVLFRPIGNQIFGAGAVLLGAVLSLGLALSRVGATWPAVWGGTMMGVLLGIVGWHYGFRNWLGVTATGLRVVNPLSDAEISWHDLVGAVGAGTALNLRTEHWSIGASAVATSGWERFLSRPSYAERVAVALMAQADQVNQANQAVAEPIVSKRRWLRPWRELPAIGTVVILLGIISYVANR